MGNREIKEENDSYNLKSVLLKSLLESLGGRKSTPPTPVPTTGGTPAKDWLNFPQNLKSSESVEQDN